MSESVNSSQSKYVPLKVILPVTSIGVFMSAMDGSIVNVSLDRIEHSLHTNITGVAWVVIAYLLATASLIGIGGALGDTFGRKKIFQIGMLLFSTGSLFCSLSTSLELLITSRVIQAVGAVGILANGLAIIITYINPDFRGRAIGINTLVVASALSVGPVLGGFLTQYYGWQSIFIINVPIGIIGIIAVQIAIKETTRKKDVKLDFKGMILFSIMSFGFVTGIYFVLGGQFLMIFLVLISIAAGYIFVKQEIKHPHPILSMAIMKKKQIMLGAFSAVFCYMSINAISFMMPLYFQDIMKFGPAKTGLYLIPIPLALSLMGPPAGFLAEKFSAKFLATLGGILETIFTITLGVVLLILDAQTPLWLIIVLMGLMAAFLSLFTNPNGTSIMNASEKHELSIVSGIIALARTIGFTLGTALSSAIFFLIFNAKGNPAKTSAQYSDVYHYALGITLIIIGIFNFIGAIISYLRGTEIKIEY